MFPEPLGARVFAPLPRRAFKSESSSTTSDRYVPPQFNGGPRPETLPPHLHLLTHFIAKLYTFTKCVSPQVSFLGLPVDKEPANKLYVPKKQFPIFALTPKVDKNSRKKCTLLGSKHLEPPIPSLSGEQNTARDVLIAFEDICQAILKERGVQYGDRSSSLAYSLWKNKDQCTRESVAQMGAPTLGSIVAGVVGGLSEEELGGGSRIKGKREFESARKQLDMNRGWYEDFPDGSRL